MRGLGGNQIVMAPDKSSTLRVKKAIVYVVVCVAVMIRGRVRSRERSTLSFGFPERQWAQGTGVVQKRQLEQSYALL
jgi:hypothetical protein